MVQQEGRSTGDRMARSSSVQASVDESGGRTKRVQEAAVVAESARQEGRKGKEHRWVGRIELCRLGASGRLRMP
jgi:hypothetical protein